MYQLRSEGEHTISWRRLAEATQLDEGAVCDAAMELCEQGFFDQDSKEIGVVSLTDQQYRRGFQRARAELLYKLGRNSRPWRVVAAVVGSPVLIWVANNV